MKEEIKNDLVRLPEEILKKGADLLRIRAERDEIELIVKNREQAVLAKIEAEYEETKDKNLSNIGKRQAEANKRLLEDEQANIDSERLKKIDKDIKETSLQLEFLNNKFKSARALALLMGE